MQLIQVLGAVVALLVTAGVGITAHELSHAAVLRSLGIPYEINWFHGQRGGGWLTPLATVTPQRIPSGTSTLGVRLSALAPLGLTLPFGLVVAGVLPDPLSSGNVFASAVTVAWMACALPSPQDFSVFWYADRVTGRQ